MRRRSLESLGVKFGTDKSSLLHGYLDFYEQFFLPWRREKICLMEFGISKGASLATWEAWFTRAEIIGVDIQQRFVSQKFRRAKTVRGDCSNRDFLRDITRKFQPTIIIDDASHRWSHQVASFEACFPEMKAGGYFVVEDLETSFGELRDCPLGYDDQGADAFQYFSQLNNMLVGNREDHPDLKLPEYRETQARLVEQIEFMVFHKGTLLIRKLS